MTKIIFIYYTFLAFFIIQVLGNSEFLTRVYMIAFGYLGLASRMRFIYRFKMFLSMNLEYIGKFDFFP